MTQSNTPAGAKPPEEVAISAYWIVKNEAENLERSLNSVKAAVDEMLVVDTGSTDESMAIARRCGATVVQRPWNDDFGDMSNFGLSLLSGDVIIRVDGDEYFDPPLGETQRRAMQTQFHPSSADILSAMRIDLEPASGEEVFREPVARIHHGHGALHYEGKWHELYRFASGDTPTRMELPGFVMIHLGFGKKAMERKVPRNLAVFRKAIAASKTETEEAWYRYFLVREYYDNGLQQQAGEALPWFLEKPGRSRLVMEQAPPHAPYFAAMMVEAAGRCGLWDAASALRREVVAVFCDMFDTYPLSRLLPLWMEHWFGGSRRALLSALEAAEREAEHLPGGRNRNDDRLFATTLAALYTATGRELWYRQRRAEALLCARRGVRLAEWPRLDAVILLADCAAFLSKRQGWLEVAESLVLNRRNLLLMIDACMRRADKQGTIEWTERLAASRWGSEGDALLAGLLKGRARAVARQSLRRLRLNQKKKEVQMCLFFATLCGAPMPGWRRAWLGEFLPLYNAFMQNTALQSDALYETMLCFYSFLALAAGRSVANRLLGLFPEKSEGTAREVMRYYLDARKCREYFEEAPALPLPPGSGDSLLLVELAIGAGRFREAGALLDSFANAAGPGGAAQALPLRELLEDLSSDDACLQGEAAPRTKGETP